MPMWCPPTPPQQENDIYIDQTMSFLYESELMSESELPPVYTRKDQHNPVYTHHPGQLKRSRNEIISSDGRRYKIPRKESESYGGNAPKSLFHSPTIVKIKRDIKMQKMRGVIRQQNAIIVPNKSGTKSELNLVHEWTIHEDMALLKVIQNYQNLPLNLYCSNPGHTPNWDFVSDYVNTVSIAYRSAKQCRQRYESTLLHREEGKSVQSQQLFDHSRKKKKIITSGGGVRSTMKTSQLFTQDNNSTFSKVMVDRFESLKRITNNKRVTNSAPGTPRSTASSTTTTKTTSSIANNKHQAVLSENGIEYDRPVMPVEVAAKRAERMARERSKLTVEQQKAHFAKNVAAGCSTVVAVQSNVAGVQQLVEKTVPQQVAVSATPITPGTPPQNVLRTQRIIASPIATGSSGQTQTVVSVSGLNLSPAQQNRLIVTTPTAGGGTQTKLVTPGKMSHQQLQLLRAATLNKQLRIHAAQQQTIVGSANTAGLKTSTVTIGGQQAVVQFTQASGSQNVVRATPVMQSTAQYLRQGGTLTVSGKTGTRTVTESEVAQILKKKHQQLQQQKLAAAAQATTSIAQVSQVFAQVPAGNLTTLVKAVNSSSGVTQTVTIPVSLATAKGGVTTQQTQGGIKTNQQKLLQMQHLLQQQQRNKALAGQKLTIAGAGGKNVGTTQLIVGGATSGGKPIQTAMTVQQFQQVIRSPLGVGQGQVVLAKGGGGTTRMIPVNTAGTAGAQLVAAQQAAAAAAQSGKQTIQVVAATSQHALTTLRPQSSNSTLAGALAGIKVQTSGSAGTTSQQTSQSILSQVSAALQNQQQLRQSGSPVRIQTVSVQQPAMQQSSSNQHASKETMDKRKNT